MRRLSINRTPSSSSWMLIFFEDVSFIPIIIISRKGTDVCTEDATCRRVHGMVTNKGFRGLKDLLGTPSQYEYSWQVTRLALLCLMYVAWIWIPNPTIANVKCCSDKVDMGVALIIFLSLSLTPSNSKPTQYLGISNSRECSGVIIVSRNGIIFTVSPPCVESLGHIHIQHPTQTSHFNTQHTRRPPPPSNQNHKSSRRESTVATHSQAHSLGQSCWDHSVIVNTISAHQI